MILIGYSGHAFVVYGILKAAGKTVSGYCDITEKSHNPFGLSYFGTEQGEHALAVMLQQGCFIAVGDNAIRNKIYDQLTLKGIRIINAIHPAAVTDEAAVIAVRGVMVAAGVVVNPLAQIGTGVICNTGSIIEHENMIGNFAHIGPGAVLCGNVTVGERSFVGANAVVKQGITIGKDVTIGAGSVVVKDVPNNSLVTGNPGRVQ